MPPSMKMLRKFFKRTSKDVKKDGVECDSVPIQNQGILPAPIPIPRESLNVHPNIATSSSYHSSTSNTYSGHSSATPYIQFSVSNSHGFHIGDVQNVHVANGSVVNFNPSPSSVNLEKSVNSLKPPAVDQSDVLIKDYSKIKDWEISFISEYITQDWKILAKCLEIGNNDLEAIEKESGNSTKDAVLEMFKLYLKNFPDTSYGFILHNLREAMQTKAFEQLLKSRS